MAKQNVFYTGDKNRDYLLGYFLGWSGFADAGLLLNIFNSGGNSWIPLNFSSDEYQHPLLSDDTPNISEPIVRGAMVQSIIKNISLMGNCLGSSEDLKKAIQLQGNMTLDLSLIKYIN